MLTIKPKHFFLFSDNVKKVLKGKVIDNLYPSNTFALEKTYNFRFRPYCEKVYISYNNSHFKAKDFGIYLLHNVLKDETILDNPKTWDVDEVKKTNLLYTPKVLKKDTTKIEEAEKNLNVEKKDFGTIQSDGESVFFKWYKKEIIHPITLLRYKTLIQSDGETKEHEKMRKVLDMIEKVYSQKDVV